MIIRGFIKKYLPEMILIWNVIVDEGNAFPQEEALALTTGLDFFNSQSHVGVAFDVGLMSYFFEINFTKSSR